MKVFNVLGNRYIGTVGKMLTASEWKGRNFLRGYRKPKYTLTQRQKKHRERMEDAADEWNDLELEQRDAYKTSIAVQKCQFSHYNGMMQSYINLNLKDEPWVPPARGTVHVQDADTGAPIYMASVRFSPHNRTSPVYVWYTDINGDYGPVALVKEDEPYSGQVVRSDYEWKVLTQVSAEEIISTHKLTKS